MELFTEERSADVVAASFAGTADPRLREVMTALVEHLHAFVKDVELTEQEWAAAIGFLTRTGQKCDDMRQEFILLSDVLGVSMLVETINHRTGGTSTESTVLGPFHVVESPPRQLGDTIALDGKGTPCLVSGRVTGPAGEPIPGASVDVWQANDDGFYDVQQPGIQPERNLRGLFTADADGRYWFRSIVPRYYPIPDDGPVGRAARGHRAASVPAGPPALHRLRAGLSAGDHARVRGRQPLPRLGRGLRGQGLAGPRRARGGRPGAGRRGRSRQPVPRADLRPDPVAGAGVTREFAYTALPMRVRFGAGELSRLPDEVAALGLGRVLVLCGPRQEAVGKQVAAALGDRCAGVLAEARMHVPVEVADRARAVAARLGADGCVAVGGGSAIGLGKAIALAHGMPVVAVPTTYAGSEMTPTWGLTEGGVKRTGRDRRVLPVSVLYDPELTVSLPPGVSAASGLNAIAHAVEGLYAPDASPIVSLMAEEGTRALAGALPAVVADGAGLDARAEAQYGAWLCGAVLGATTTGLHHKLCHTLGGGLDLPHAETHAVILPHALAFNAPAAPQAVAALARALGGDADPARELWELAGRLGVPRSLRELGMAEDDIDPMAGRVAAAGFPNPRPVTRDAVATLLRAAWAGSPPG